MIDLQLLGWGWELEANSSLNPTDVSLIQVRPNIRTESMTSSAARIVRFHLVGLMRSSKQNQNMKHSSNAIGQKENEPKKQCIYKLRPDLTQKLSLIFWGLPVMNIVS